MIIVVIFITCIVIMIWLLVSGKREARERLLMLEKFKTDPYYKNELAMLRSLGKTEFVSDGDTIRRKGGIGAKKNIELAAQLIKEGAELVLGMGLVSSWGNSDSRRAICVVMPHAAFSAGLPTNTALIRLNLEFQDDFKVSSHAFATSSTTTKKKASVVGQAVAGGILAGGAGAVVGAINAASQNSSGGKTITTYDNYENEYFVDDKRLGRRVDSILINTKLFEKFGRPPEKYVVSRGQDYWQLSYIETIGTRSLGYRQLTDKNRRNLDELFNYIDTIYQDHAATAKDRYHYNYFCSSDFA